MKIKLSNTFVLNYFDMIHGHCFMKRVIRNRKCLIKENIKRKLDRVNYKWNIGCCTETVCLMKQEYDCKKNKTKHF